MRTFFQFLNNRLIPLLPDTRFFGFKRFMWKLAGVQIGENVRICSSVTIIGRGKLSIGSNTWIGPKAMISSSESISIGRDCDLAPRVYIGDGTHEISSDMGRIASIEVTKPIYIGDGCWICVNSTILAGVRIGNKCVVAAGAVVTRSFKDNKILIAGIPAVKKKEL